MERPVAAVITLGCKLNLAESEVFARALQAKGFATTGALCEAAAYIINTCSVTHVADQKSRRLIRAARRLSPLAPVAAIGCFTRAAGAEAARALGADFVCGSSPAEAAALAEEVFARAGPRPHAAPTGAEATLRVRAFVKAQEGCNDACAFCIVPRTRGRERSLATGEVVAAVRAAHERGAQEVVITGTQPGAWGRDLGQALALPHLLAAVLEGTDVPRVRVSSLQPADITPELLGAWQDPRLMPHFHLALQSGSDRVLAAMRRRYSRREFLAAAERIRGAIAGVAITTDVIAGFPGETAAEFDETLATCREAGFARLHGFPYSPRARTLAAQLPGTVPPAELRARMSALLALGEELALAFRRRFSGTVQPVLWESERSTPGGRAWHGHTGNYIAVYARGEALANRITPIRLGGVYHDGLEGELEGGAR